MEQQVLPSAVKAVMELGYPRRLAQHHYRVGMRASDLLTYLDMHVDNMGMEEEKLLLKKEEEAAAAAAMAALAIADCPKVEEAQKKDEEEEEAATALAALAIADCPKVEDEYQLLRRETLCLLSRKYCASCHEQERTYVLLPCSHFALCDYCHSLQSVCPLCHEPIHCSIRTYLS